MRQNFYATRAFPNTFKFLKEWRVVHDKGKTYGYSIHIPIVSLPFTETENFRDQMNNYQVFIGNLAPWS